MTKILAQTALRNGSNILGAETHGMAQRGGSVISHLRIGDAKSRLINTGSAHYMSMEKKKIVPRAAVRDYLEKRRGTTRVMPAGRIAMELGAPSSTNLALLGFMSAFADNPFEAADMRETIERITPDPFKSINLKVFDAGVSRKQEIDS